MKIFLLFSAAFFLTFLPQFIASNETKIKIEVDAMVSSGQILQIFIHDQPTSLPIEPGVRKKYVFEVKDVDIAQLRIDPTNFQNSKFKIFGVHLKSSHGDTIYQTIDIRNWIWNGSYELKDGTDYSGISSNADPMLLSPAGQINYLANKPSAFNNFLQEIKRSPSRIIIVIFIFTVLNLITQQRKHTWFLTMFFCIYFSCAGPFFNFIFSYATTPPGAVETVGWISYNGYPKIIDFIYFVLVGTFILISGGLFAMMSQSIKLPLVSEDVYIKLNRKEYFLIFLVYFLFCFPDFHSQYEVLKSGIRVSSWDEMNVLTWKYFFENSLVPIKDFWYPYGSQNWIFGPFWQDNVLSFIHRIAIFSFFFLGISSLLSNKKLPVLICLATFALVNFLDLNLGYSRYFTSFAIYVYFFSVFYRNTFRIRDYIIMSCANIWLCLLEPHQFIYSLFGQAAVFLICFGYQWHSKDELYLKKVKIFLISILSTFALAFVYYHSTGQLIGLLEFFKQTSGYSNNASLPVDFTSILRDPFSFEGNIFHLYFLMLGILGYISVRSLVKHKNEILFISGSISFLLPLMGKNLIRPHIAQQIIGIQILCLVILYFIRPRHELKQSTRLFIAVFTGVMLGYVLRDLNWSRVKSISINLANAITSPFRTDSVYFSTPKHDLVSQFYRPKYSTIPGFDFEKLLGEIETRFPNKKLFVLGDLSILYTAIHQHPPYTLSFYDGAHVELQKKQLEWLKNSSADVIVWNPHYKSFDSVPFIVKDPRLFKYIISHYKYASEWGDFHFLTKKTNPTVDVKYWVSSLGPNIDFKYIGSNPSTQLLEPCAPAIEECSEFIEIESKKFQNSSAHFKGEIEGMEVTIQFQARNNEKIVIPADAIWFWSLVKGDKHTFFKNCDYKIVSKRKLRDFLY